MQKKNYASGFLYHPETHQILLQQLKTPGNKYWTLFGIDNASEENIKDRLLEEINESLNLKIKFDSIYSVYNYVHKEKNVFIFYAVVNKVHEILSSDCLYSWFTFKQIQKLPVTEQTKQDLIVGQRVIDSFIRKSMGLRTIG